MENTKLLKKNYQKPLIKSEQLDLNAVAQQTCTCSGSNQGSFVQNAVGIWSS
jgi:hypothetical protein